MAQSKARCMKVEYIAATGLKPWQAIPAAKTAACSSAMPTSKNCEGNSFFKYDSPVPDAIAAVIPTVLGSFWASFKRVLPIASW